MNDYLWPISWVSSSSLWLPMSLSYAYRFEWPLFQSLVFTLHSIPFGWDWIGWCVSWICMTFSKKPISSLKKWVKVRVLGRIPNERHCSLKRSMPGYKIHRPKIDDAKCRARESMQTESIISQTKKSGNLMVLISWRWNWCHFTDLLTIYFPNETTADATSLELSFARCIQTNHLKPSFRKISTMKNCECLSFEMLKSSNLISLAQHVAL